MTENREYTVDTVDTTGIITTDNVKCVDTIENVENKEDNNETKTEDETCEHDKHNEHNENNEHNEKSDENSDNENNKHTGDDTTDTDDTDFLIIDRKIKRMYVILKDGAPILTTTDKKRMDKKIDNIVHETIISYLDHHVYLNCEFDNEEEKLYVLTISPKNQVWKNEREIHTISVYLVDYI